MGGALDSGLANAIGVTVLQVAATIAFGCFFATFVPLLVMVVRHALREC